MNRLVACSLVVLASVLDWPVQAPRVEASADSSVVVVVGRAFPRSDISLAALKMIFRGRRIEIGGIRMLPFNHPLGSPLRETMDRLLLGLEPSAVGSFWIDARIRDQGQPPRTASSSALGMRVVAALPGAITYARPADITKYVKVLTVDGKAPGTQGYPLIQ